MPGISCDAMNSDGVGSMPWRILWQGLCYCKDSYLNYHLNDNQCDLFCKNRFPSPSDCIQADNFRGSSTTRNSVFPLPASYEKAIEEENREMEQISQWRNLMDVTPYEGTVNPEYVSKVFCNHEII